MEHAWARIVVVAYNSGTDLLRCIQALNKQTDQDFEVVVVDNDSPDKCVEQLSIPKNKITILRAFKNLGFAGGTNFGAKGAKTDWIIALNPDTVAKPNWFEQLKASALEKPEVDMWASVVLDSENEGVIDSFGDVFSTFGIAWQGGRGQSLSRAPKANVSVFAPCGAVGAYKREIFEYVGGFDEKFFCYLEDVDLGLRINVLGGQARIAHQAYVLHVGSASSKDHPEFPIYQTCANNIYMLVKSLPILLLPAIFCIYVATMILVVIRNRNDAFHSARIRGLSHGVRNLPSAIRDRKHVRRSQYGSVHLLPKLCMSVSKLIRHDIYYWDK